MSLICREDFRSKKVLFQGSMHIFLDMRWTKSEWGILLSYATKAHESHTSADTLTMYLRQSAISLILYVLTLAYFFWLLARRGCKFSPHLRPQTPKLPAAGDSRNYKKFPISRKRPRNCLCIHISHFTSNRSIFS